MNTLEIEFLAEKELVTIIPNFSQDKIYLIAGDIGPFNPSLPVQVPLWLAINLKQRQKCRIIPPEWMEVEKLEELKQQETESKYFSVIASVHYMEIANLLLKYAANDIPYADEIRTLIKDIWDVRSAKLRSSIATFINSGESQARLDHMTLMEINTVRPLLINSLDQLHFLRRSGRIFDEDSQNS